MNEEELEQIRGVIKQELVAFMRELYRSNERFDHPRLRSGMHEELNRFAFLNDQFAAIVNAGDLMKGCKYEENKINSISSTVNNIDAKT